MIYFQNTIILLAPFVRFIRAAEEQGKHLGLDLSVLLRTTVWCKLSNTRLKDNNKVVLENTLRKSLRFLNQKMVSCRFSFFTKPTSNKSFSLLICTVNFKVENTQIYEGEGWTIIVRFATWLLVILSKSRDFDKTAGNTGI